MPSPSGTQSGSALRLHHPGPAQPHHMPAPAAQGFASRPFPPVMGVPLGAQPASRPIHSHMALPVSAQQGSAAVVTSGARRPHQAPAAVFPRPLPTAAVSSTAQNGSAQFSAAARQAMALQLHTAMLEVSRQQAVRQAQQQQGGQAQGRAPGMQPPSHRAMSFPGQPATECMAPHMQATVPSSAARAASQPQASAAGRARSRAPAGGLLAAAPWPSRSASPSRGSSCPAQGRCRPRGPLRLQLSCPTTTKLFMQVALAVCILQIDSRALCALLCHRRWSCMRQSLPAACAGCHCQHCDLASRSAGHHTEAEGRQGGTTKPCDLVGCCCC